MLHVTLVFTLGVVPVSQPQELSQWCSHLLYTQPGCIVWRQLVEHSYVLACTHIVIHQKHIDCSLRWLNKHLIHLDSMLVKFCCHYILATNQLNVSHPAQPTCSAWNQCIPERLSLCFISTGLSCIMLDVIQCWYIACCKQRYAMSKLPVVFKVSSCWISNFC